MNIGVDIMGGDYAPYAVVEGVVDSLEHLSADDRGCRQLYDFEPQRGDTDPDSDAHNALPLI